METELETCAEEERNPAPGPEGTVTPEEHRLRINVLKEAMARKRVDVAIVHNSRDVYYYSGTALYCFLVVPAVGDPVLLVRINVARARVDSWIPDVRQAGGLHDIRDVLRERGFEQGVIGIEEDVTLLSLYKKFVELFPGSIFVDLGSQILQQRMIKSPVEVAMVRRAARISRVGMEKATSLAGVGVSEIDIASGLEAAKRAVGDDGVMFRRRQGVYSVGDSLVSSGKNLSIVSGYWVTFTGPGPSAALPYGPSTRRLRKGDLLGIDQSSSFRGYLCDEGKMFVIGKASEKHKRLFDVVRRAQDAAITIIKPGVPASEAYLAAWRVVQEAGYANYFMAYGEYGVEYLGHGLGLEIDELPLIGPKTATLFEEGMIIALEPKLIIPGWGCVDLEDTLAVTCDGCEVLTEWPREITEIPA